MKVIQKFYIAIVSLLSFTIPGNAQDCQMPVRVVVDKELANIPVGSESILYQTLNRIATEAGFSTDSPTAPFVLTIHVDVLEKNVLPGPPVQVVNNLGITLYIADMYTQQKFASEYIEVNGIGNGESKSYTNAFRNVRPATPKIKSFIENGKKKMMNYYDTQYNNIIKEAQKLADQGKYAEAIVQIMSVPTCSKGGDAATQAGLAIYNRYRDKCNLLLFNQAKAIWVATQNEESAKEAASLLAMVDPEAACYNEAVQEMAEIKKSIRADIDFEMREKYHDAVHIELQRIECMKAVGTAFGSGQQPITTNLMWLR